MLNSPLVAGIEVGRAQILIRLLPRQHVIHHGQDGMAQGYEHACLAPSGGHASVLGCQVCLLGFRRHMGRLHQHLAQPSTALGGLAAEARAPTVVMARAHARSGGQRLGTREPCYVRTNFGQQDLRRPLTDSRNRVQEGHRLLLGLQVLGDHRTDTSDGVIEVVDLAQILREEEAMVGAIAL